MLSHCYVWSSESKWSVSCAAPCSAPTLGGGWRELLTQRVVAFADVFPRYGLGQDVLFSWTGKSGFSWGFMVDLALMEHLHDPLMEHLHDP